MASKALYHANVGKELGNAYEHVRVFSPCQEAIQDAATLVYKQAPIYDVVERIVNAMRHSTNEKVLFSLSQAIAWIGPMGE